MPFKIRLEPWEKNLYIIWIAQVAVMLGFSFVVPFISLYILELGITDTKEAALWSGVSAAAHGIGGFLLAPVWGYLADRFGRKPMVIRAMFGGGLTVAVIGMVSNVYELVGLRLLQGTLSGTVAASMALVAAMTPRSRMGYSMGLLNTAVFIGSTLGPLVGGVLADFVGYRSTFFITGAIILLGGAIVLFFVEEDFKPVQRGEKAERGAGLLESLGFILRSKDILPILAVLSLTHAGPQIISPILPLFIQSLTHGERVASTAGFALFVLGLVSILSAVLAGSVSHRISLKLILIASCVGSGLLYIPQALVHNITQLLVLMAILGLFKGGMLTAGSALIGVTIPRARHGMAYAAVQSANALGVGLAPLGGGLLAASLGLRPVFAITGALFLLIGLGVAKALGKPVGEGHEEIAEGVVKPKQLL